MTENTDKQFLYNERKANPTLIWILFLLLGWSYGSLGKVGYGGPGKVIYTEPHGDDSYWQSLYNMLL